MLLQTWISTEAGKSETEPMSEGLVSVTFDPQNGKLIYVDGTLRDVPVKCMVDTGATMSLVSLSCVALAKLIPVEGSYIQIQFGNKSLSTVNRVIKNQLVLSTASTDVQSKLYVYDNLTCDVLLGLDFLAANNFVIRVTSRNEAHISIERDEQVFPVNCVTYPDDIVKFRSPIDIILQPRSTTQVFLNSEEVLTGNVLLESALYSSVLQTPTALVFVTDGNAYTNVVNPSNDVTKLAKDEVVAFVNFTQHVPYEKERETGIPHINPDLNEDQRHDIDKLIKKFADLFDSSKTGLIRAAEHRIILKNPDVQPIKCAPYRVSLAERKIMQQQIERFLKAGHAIPSCSPWAFPVVLVKKKGSDNYRVAVDYRKLNALTANTTSAYPLPKISDVLDSLRNCQYFSTFDLVGGFHQIAMHPDDRKYTAFVTPFGLHEWTVMPFGLQGAPATFQKTMDTILASVKYDMALAYLDDVIVYAKEWEEMVHRLDTVLSILLNSGVKLQPSKCYIAYTTIKYLGYVVSKEGFSPDPEKTKAVEDFNVPKSLYHLRAFLGLTSYYRIFIPNYAVIASPLYNLLRDNVKFEWTDLCQKSFEKLKLALTSSPIMAHYRDDGDLVLYTDASYDGIGAILAQKQDGVERVISYLSRTLRKAEKNYTISEIECLSIVHAITRFRPYLFGREFTVVTDHQALIYLFRNNEQTPKISRWILKLQEYRFSVKHRSGAAHTNADAISRMFNPSPLGKHDHQINVMSKQELADLQENDSFCNEIKKKKNAEVDADTGILKKVFKTPYGDKKVTILPAILRHVALQHLHDDHGHLSHDRTYALLRSRFYFKNMYRYVNRYIKTCSICLKRNKSTHKPVGNLQPLPPVPLFTRMGLDYVGPFPLTQLKNQYLLVCTDYGSKWVEVGATKKADAHYAADFIYHRIILRFGCVKEIVTDQGSHFCNELVQSLLNIFGIRHRKSTAYRPQTNGQTERANKTVVDILSKYVNDTHTDWDQYVPLVQWFLNTTPSASTKESAFRILYGIDPILPIDLSIEGCNDKDFAASLRDSHELIRQTVLSNIKTAQDRNIKEYNSRHRIVNYTPGEFVLLFRHTTPQGLSRKLVSRYQGPYVILRQIGPNNYEILDVRPSARNSKPENVSVTRLKPFNLRFPPVKTHTREEENVVVPSRQGQALKEDHQGYDDEVTLASSGAGRIGAKENKNQQTVTVDEAPAAVTEKVQKVEPQNGQVIDEEVADDQIDSLPPKAVTDASKKSDSREAVSSTALLVPPPRRSKRNIKLPIRYRS